MGANKTSTPRGIRIAIDRGGTFCDVIAQVPGRQDLVFKLLSVDPQNYRDAPTEAIRRVLQAVEGREIPVDEKLDASAVETCRIGTTVATNALLEHKGKKFALVTTRGLKDLCEIGDESRPRLFDLNIRKPKLLFDSVVEATERVTIENYDLDPFPAAAYDENDPGLVRTESGEVVRIIQPLDVDSMRTTLRQLRDVGYDSVAICFIHSHIYPDHEKQAGQIAQDEGFKYITLSSDVSPRIMMLQRATAACTDAYLSPIVSDYVGSFLDGFRKAPQRVDFMSSDGGLRQAHRFTGNAALISGPAGGVVGVARSCYDIHDPRALIGFDMVSGGTSTDVCRYDGKFDHIIETTIAGRKISTPMLNLSTVAAGGGSMLFVRNGLFVVGPESAGAHPGPACYRKGGPLTITDANLYLGRLVISSFPSIFGEKANEPLDTVVVATKFTDLTAQINAESNIQLTPEQVARGFIQVANESMCRPIRNATEARGYASQDHNLVSFGGAGGQHACAIASNLGIKRILIHRYSSLLSAYGISLAEISSELMESVSFTLSPEVMPRIHEREEILKSKLESNLRSQGVEGSKIEFQTFLNLHYRGSDTILSVEEPGDEDYSTEFNAMHLREFAFQTNRDIIVESIRIRGTARSATEQGVSVTEELERIAGLHIKPEATSFQEVFLEDSWEKVPVYDLATMQTGSHIKGPAMITDETQTILVEKDYESTLTSQHIVIDQVVSSDRQHVDANEINPIQLSCFANRFMSIAEQMGHTLQRTAMSTSIKERLDFSCAIFSPDGGLVANAPHIPIHLGSMEFAIQYQHRLWGDKLKPGDVLLTNHPEAGGVHLPDLTVVTPAFYGDELVFYVASRGHHSDIGGIGITSMIPDSKELWQEGMAVKSALIVSGGVFQEQQVRALFEEVAQHPGCSATRRLQDNISDIKAKISANQKGISLIERLCAEFTLPVVHLYMGGIQSNAELAIRDLFRDLHRRFKGKPLRAVDWFDDGTPVQVEIRVDGETGTAVFDFAGSGAQTWGNMNMPISITHSAVIYVLRCLVDLEIPLNQGCLKPCTILLPPRSIVNPSPTVAICGSTIASQRVTDVLLQAFGAAAGSQGCANSLGWGMGGTIRTRMKTTSADAVATEKVVVVPGWNYGETVGGGSGAGPSWHGVHAVNVHSTNTRATDVEVIEKRTPVLIRRSAIRSGTGGRGLYRGGDGMIREVEARMPMRFSILSERRVYGPYGLAGGEPGAVGVNYIFKKESSNSDGEVVLERINIGAKAVVQLNPGDYIQINSPGGGGWGTPEHDNMLDGNLSHVRPTPTPIQVS